MKRILITIFALNVLWLQAQQPGGVKAVSLKEAIDFALEFNTKAKNSKLDQDIAKARNWEIMATGLPNINAELGYTYYFKRPVSPAFSSFFSDTTQTTARVFNYLASQDPAIANILYNSAIQSKDSKFSFVLPHNISSSLSVSQLIFDGRYFIGLKATKDFTKTARLQKNLSDIDIAYNVKKAYYQAAAANEAVMKLNDNLKLVQKLLTDTRETYKQGLVEELDVDRLALAENQLQSQITLQTQMAKVAIDNLKFQMGMNLGDDLILKDNLEDLRSQITVDAELTFDVTKRTENELLETAIRIRGYDVAQRKSGYFPSMFAFLNYGWQAQSSKFGDLFKSTITTYPDGDTRKNTQWFDQGLVGLTLKLPIFDSGSRLANMKQAKLDQQKAINELENFKQAAELQYRASYSQFQSALIDEANNKRATELSEKIFKTNQIKYKEGLGSSFELVQSENDNATNHLKKIQSILSLLNAKADLDKALGIK
jgi:outer membrane protein TolC